MTEGVFNCLYDKKRTLAFKKAIRQTVRKGDIVVDAGSGTGVMAMFAADAGAKRVYAVEFDEINVHRLRQIFASNGYGKKIKVISADTTKVKMPEKVDVIVCEMIATGLIEELQVPAMNNILKYVNRGYRVVLKEYSCHADLVDHKNVFYNKKFDIPRYEYPDKPSLRSKVLSNRVTYKVCDFSQPIRDVRVVKQLDFSIQKRGHINGLRLYGTTMFHGNTSFAHSFSYSFPVILPLDNFAVARGDKLTFDLRYRLCGGFESLRYTLAK
jgi:predicted RNA methylase